MVTVQSVVAYDIAGDNRAVGYELAPGVVPGHPAREEQTVVRSLQRRQLRLRDALGGITVPPILHAVDPTLEVILQLLGIGERVGGGLHDRRGQRVGRLGAGLAAVHGHRAGAARLRRRVHALVHHGTSRRAFSTWRAMARATRLESAGSSTGLLRCDGLMPSSAPMW